MYIVEKRTYIMISRTNSYCILCSHSFYMVKLLQICLEKIRDVCTSIFSENNTFSIYHY